LCSRIIQTVQHVRQVPEVNKLLMAQILL
jgi:hypothetical protein